MEINLNDRSYEFSFHTEPLTNCCGIIELGDFNIQKDMPVGELVKVLDSVAIQKNKTTLITTNGKDSSVIMEKALTASKYFTLVKSFRNGSNSGNTVKIWLSSNE